MRTYKIVNNVTGWFVFLVAAFTYCSTIEPTASFWDCPEFITTAYKLEVGHPPGAPFFMLFGKLFTLFASDASQVAKMINIMSALLSAGCILFLFWSITHLVKKLIGAESLPALIGVMASGVCGALVYTWSDTFWFSAVEGEVYAFSSFFTALVFWLILKWEDNAEDPHSDRWLVFIAYLIGLSIGVHLLNLLCIPAIVLVCYYRKGKNPNLRGSLIALCISALVIVAVLYGIVPGLVKMGGWFELLFVNTFGLGYNSGLYVYLVLMVGALVWALWETEHPTNRSRMNLSFLVSFALLGIPFYGHGVSAVVIGIAVLAVLAALLFMLKKVNVRLLNTALLCMTLIVVGYSSYALIVIRSTANPPMDQNSPEDVFALGTYLSREQYGDRPLFWGQTYNSKPNIVSDGKGSLIYQTKKGEKVYQRKDKEDPGERDEYVVVNQKFEYVYPTNQCMLFPRIYDERHKGNYEQWLGKTASKRVTYVYPGQGSEVVTLPTWADNMRFFFSYQVNFMYWRYFLWNFAGRQNDRKSGGEWEHGNWLTGFSWIDNARLGDQNLLPDELKNNKAHNVFYCLPLIIGLLGFFWQAFRGREGIQQFWVVFFLFFMTGLAIVVYLNQTPNQPRERDYAYAGSFYAFAIWCGMGVAAVYEWIGKALAGKRSGALSAALISCIPALAIPLQMVSQTWDDHDRSGRFICRDFGLDYLETVPHDGIIFTNGDNDTFPLWYNEDTEGNRTDVRVCNLSYLQTDWYIDQMKRPAFAGEEQSSPLPISWMRYEYTTGTHEATDVNPEVTLPNGQKARMKELVAQLYATDSVAATKIWGAEPFELSNAIQKFVLKRNLPAEYSSLTDKLPSCLPSDSLYINVDKRAVLESGMVVPRDSLGQPLIPDRMYIDVGQYSGYGQKLSEQNRLYKNSMMMLEMIANANFSRPIYMSTTVGPSYYGSLYHHFLQEGIAWRITPFTYEQNRVQNTVADTDRMYDNMVNRYKYGNLSQPGLYLDETTHQMCCTMRRWFGVLINQLLSEGDTQRALRAAEKCLEEIPGYNVPHDEGSGSLDIAHALLVAGKGDEGEEIMDQVISSSRQYFDWYINLPDGQFRAFTSKCLISINEIYMAQRVYMQLVQESDDDDAQVAYGQRVDELEAVIQKLYSAYVYRCNALGISV